MYCGSGMDLVEDIMTPDRDATSLQLHLAMSRREQFRRQRKALKFSIFWGTLGWCGFAYLLLRR